MLDDESNDGGGPWFHGDDIDFPDSSHPKVIPMEVLRNQAIVLFGRFLAMQNNAEPETYADLTEEKCEFLSLQETETIVRSFSAMDNGEIMAVGGNSKQEAIAQIRQLMAALIERVLSNVIAAGVKQDLIDTWFDETRNSFDFEVSEKGKQLLEQHKDLFDDV